MTMQFGQLNCLHHADAVNEGKYLYQERVMGQEKEAVDEKDLAVRSYGPDSSSGSEAFADEGNAEDANNMVDDDDDAYDIDDEEM